MQNKVKVSCDSQSVIYLAMIPTYHSKEKHILVKYHFLRHVIGECRQWLWKKSIQSKIVQTCSQTSFVREAKMQPMPCNEGDEYFGHESIQRKIVQTCSQTSFVREAKMLPMPCNEGDEYFGHDISGKLLSRWRLLEVDNYFPIFLV